MVTAVKPEPFLTKRLLPPDGSQTTESFLKAVEGADVDARRELRKATACRCVIEVLALWGMPLPSGRGMPLAPCLWERPPRGPDPRQVSSASG